MKSSTKALALDGPLVSLQEMLECRDARQEYQRFLLDKYSSPTAGGQESGGSEPADITLICFTVNMAGPVKLCEAARLVHRGGMAALRREFASVLEFSTVRELNTGMEGYLVVAENCCEVKRITCRLEDGAGCGRLMDIDVHTGHGQLSRSQLGLPQRRCLLCERPAPECSRSRRHSLAELLAKTQQLAAECIDLEQA